MSTPRRGLGRGLAALLGENAVPVSSSQDVVREIPLTEITPNPFQPRKQFDGRHSGQRGDDSELHENDCRTRPVTANGQPRVI